MKILTVVHGFPPHAQGGSEIVAELQTRTLREQYGDTVFVMTREHDTSAPEYRVRTEHRDGQTIAWINNTFRSTRSFAETYDNPAITQIAANLIEAFAPDVAHVHHLTCLSTGIVPLLARCGCTASGFLDSGLTVFASTPPRPARGGRVAPGPGFGSRTSPASTARCTSA